MKKQLNSKVKALFIFLIIVIILGAGILTYLHFFSSEKSFHVSPYMIKSVIKQGDKISNEIVIINGDKDKTFEINLEGVEDFVNVNEMNFYLNAREEKILKITLESREDKYEPGVYTGRILIKSGTEEKEIPIVLEIESKTKLFTISLSFGSEYNVIRPGEKIVADIKFFNPYGFDTSKVKVSYLIKNFKGENVISLEKEEIEISSKTAISKTKTLPKDLEFGNYIFIVLVEHNGITSTSSYIFNVGKKETSLIKNVNFFVLIILLFLIGIIFLIGYILYERSQLFSRLKKQHNTELEEVTQLFESKKRELKKIKRVVEYHRKLDNVQKQEKRILDKLKKKQEKQKREFDKLKKQGKKKEMLKKLREWKEQGYYGITHMKSNPTPLKSQMKKQVSAWLKKGYHFNLKNKASKRYKNKK